MFGVCEVVVSCKLMLEGQPEIKADYYCVHNLSLTECRARTLKVRSSRTDLQILIVWVGFTRQESTHLRLWYIQTIRYDYVVTQPPLHPGPLGGRLKVPQNCIALSVSSRPENEYILAYKVVRLSPGCAVLRPARSRSDQITWSFHDTSVTSRALGSLCGVSQKML